MSLRKENIFVYFNHVFRTGGSFCMINLRIVMNNLFFTITDISPRIVSLMSCCCVSIIIVICICPPGTLIFNFYFYKEKLHTNGLCLFCFLGFARRMFYPALFTLLYFITLVVATSF